LEFFAIFLPPPTSKNYISLVELVKGKTSCYATLDKTLLKSSFFTLEQEGGERGKGREGV